MQVDIASFQATSSIEKQAAEQNRGKYLGIIDRVKHIKVGPGHLTEASEQPLHLLLSAISAGCSMTLTYSILTTCTLELPGWQMP